MNGNNSLREEKCFSCSASLISWRKFKGGKDWEGDDTGNDDFLASIEGRRAENGRGEDPDEGKERVWIMGVGMLASDKVSLQLTSVKVYYVA